MAERQPSFLDELKQRNVIRVGLAYAVFAWVVAQVADLVLENFDAPSWIIQTTLIVLAIGFPVALLLAWVFELTPDGIKREADVVRSESTTARRNRTVDFALIALLSCALAYLAVRHDWGGAPEPVAHGGSKSIAVLPFVNMSESAENAFFTNGVHEDVLTYLSKVADLRVIARSSVRQFTGDDPDVTAIAGKLGVGHIVEGSVRRAGQQVRVSAQLIDARTEEQVWAESYDRDLSDVFEIQSAIARDIVTALQAELSPSEAVAINQAPTTSIAAYDKFAEAREISRVQGFGAAQAISMEPLLKQAVALDPDFALAHAELGGLHTTFYWLDLDRSPERLQQARASIDRAFALEPDLPEARAALAEYYYRGFQNYERALDQLLSAYERFPNNTRILELMGVLQRRLGQWDASIESLRAAAQLDPGDLGKKHLLLETMVTAHRWDEAAAYADALLEGGTPLPSVRALRASVYAFGDGNLAAADALLGEPGDPVPDERFKVELFIALCEGDFARASGMLDQYDQFLGYLPAGARDFLEVWIAAFSGDDEGMRQHATDAIDALAPIVAEDRNRDAMWVLLSAEAHARLGQTDKALAMTRRVLETNPIQADTFAAPDLHALAAVVLALGGDTDGALELLARIVDQPGGPTRWELRLHPRWDVLRGEPRFVTLAGGNTPR